MIYESGGEGWLLPMFVLAICTNYIVICVKPKPWRDYEEMESDVLGGQFVLIMAKVGGSI